MRHSLENHLLRIEVESKGAELASLVKKATQMEYMWQADPAVWGSHAPVLFPIIGVLKDGKTRINGQEYSIPKHGMVRHNEDLELYSQTEDRITFRLKCNEETGKHYPYNFEFLVTYRLRNEHVIVYHEIYNEDTQPIYFCLGGHPAFRVPSFQGEAYHDYQLRFENDESSESHEVLADGTIGPHTRPVPWKDGNILPLTHDLFNHDALVFKDLNSISVILESVRRGPVLKMDFAGWTHLGIWAKPNGDFVCIEPWMGLSDPHDSDGEFINKEGIIKLDPSGVYERSYDIKIL
jgi:galactose mutarotase-like enzyme